MSLERLLNLEHEMILTHKSMIKSMGKRLARLVHKFSNFIDTFEKSDPEKFERLENFYNHMFEHDTARTVHRKILRIMRTGNL